MAGGTRLRLHSCGFYVDGLHYALILSFDVNLFADFFILNHLQITRVSLHGVTQSIPIQNPKR